MSERSSDRAIERSSDRAIERSSDRASDRADVQFSFGADKSAAHEASLDSVTSSVVALVLAMNGIGGSGEAF